MKAGSEPHHISLHPQPPPSPHLAGVLGQGARDDLEGLGELAHGVLVQPVRGIGQLGDPSRQLDLGGPTPRHEATVRCQHLDCVDT